MTNMVKISHMANLEGARTHRFVVMLTDAELQAIEDYQFSQRLGSKAKAARRLIEAGIKKESENRQHPIAGSL